MNSRSSVQFVQRASLFPPIKTEADGNIVLCKQTLFLRWYGLGRWAAAAQWDGEAALLGRGPGYL